MSSLPICAIALLSATSVAAQDTFVNFEGPQTHPIRVSADEARLFTVLTPDARLCVWSLHEASDPVLLDEIPVGLEPVSVTQRTDDEVWVANFLSDSVSVVSLSEGRVVDTLRVKDEPSDIVFAGGKAFVSAGASDDVHVFDAVTHAPLGIIDIDGKDPRAMAVSPDGATVYVLIQRSGNRTSVIPKGQAPPQPDPWNPLLPPAPQEALVVSMDDPAWTGYFTFDLEDYDLARIDVATETVAGYTSGIGTINQDLAVDPDTGDVYVVGIHSRNDVIFEPVLRGHAIDSGVSRVAGGSGSVQQIDLNPTFTYAVLPDPAALAIALAEPTGIIVDSDDDLLYIAAQGTDRIGVIALGGGIVDRIEVGVTPGTVVDPKEKRGPRGLALAPSADRLYVLNRLSQTVAIVDTVSRTMIAEIPNGSNDPTPADIREGRGFLYDSKLSGNGSFSCAACHWDAELDGLAWDLGNPAGDLVFPPTHPDPLIEAILAPMYTHPMKGAMLTQTLRGLAGTGALHWRGDKPLFQDFNGAFDGLMGGSTLSSTDMDLYSDFGLSIANPPNPNLALDGQYAGAQLIGLDLFNNNLVEEILPSKNTCNACHTLPVGTSTEILPSPKGPIKPAPLRNLYRRLGMNLDPAGVHKSGFGVPHDGHTTLAHHVDADTFQIPDALVPDMIEFLLAMDTGTPPATGYEIQLSQATLGSPDLSVDLPILEQLSVAGSIDLVAKGTVLGDRHGLLYDPINDRYDSDATGLGPYLLADLEALAASGDADITFVGVPFGSGTRIGIDRDLDGILDGDVGGIPYGAATSSCTLDPTIAMNSTPYLGNENFAFLGETVPGAFGVLVLGSSAIQVPLLGFELLVQPILFVNAESDATGTAAVRTPIDLSLAPGSTVFAQFVWIDSCGTQGLTASNGLEVSILP